MQIYKPIRWNTDESQLGRELQESFFQEWEGTKHRKASKKNEILTICVNVGKNIKNTDIYIDNLMQKKYICVKVGKKRIITEVYTNADDI